jgi:hypothetical protein
MSTTSMVVWFCSVCGYKSMRSSHVHAHHKSVHAGERPYSCPFGCATFKLKYHYNRHLLAKHMDDFLAHRL